MQYKGIELKCAQEEFDEFRASVPVSYTIHDFSELYNGAVVSNPTGVENAKYYVLKSGDIVYLQTHTPNDEGFLPMTDANIMGYINAHVDMITENLAIAKYAKTQEDVINELRTQLATATDGLTVIQDAVNMLLGV